MNTVDSPADSSQTLTSTNTTGECSASPRPIWRPSCAIDRHFGHTWSDVTVAGYGTLIGCDEDDRLRVPNRSEGSRTVVTRSFAWIA